MKREIVTYPNEILTKKARPVAEITPEIITLLDDMYETMVAYDGVGIAAPQVGISLQVVVIEVEENDTFELINPEIIQQSGSQIVVEGCLSFPDIYGTIDRADVVTVRYYDRDGDQMEVEASGYLAQAFQHEIEHLQGELFTDSLIHQLTEEELAELEQEGEEEIND